VPTPEALDTTGLKVSETDLAELLRVDLDGWKKEAEDVAESYKKFGDRLPAALEKELYDLGTRLSTATLPLKNQASPGGS
jgi:phosphoenolpyruvate carboxykinase (GTP)